MVQEHSVVLGVNSTKARDQRRAGRNRSSLVSRIQRAAQPTHLQPPPPYPPLVQDAWLRVVRSEANPDTRSALEQVLLEEPGAALAAGAHPADVASITTTLLAATRTHRMYSGCVSSLCYCWAELEGGG